LVGEALNADEKRFFNDVIVPKLIDRDANNNLVYNQNAKI
jgi:hypothetical protein